MEYYSAIKRKDIMKFAGKNSTRTHLAKWLDTKLT